jgi:hypothetical protein
VNAPIRVPGDPEPYDPLVGKDRPKEVQDEKEISHRPRDEAVEFRRATARFGRGKWREPSQGRCWRCGLVIAISPGVTGTRLRIVIASASGHWHD